jgi:uncharacterized C2H2 Zn-finger protein
MPPEKRPYLYKCPHCAELFYEREVAIKHIKEKHYAQIEKSAGSAASFFSWKSHGK